MRLTPWLHGLDLDGLTTLFALRPDACRVRPGSVPELARHLSGPASVAACVERLDHDCLAVAQAVVVLGDGADVARVRELVRGPDTALESALTRLRERALVWPGARGRSLRFTVALHRHWAHPLDLGPTTATVLDRVTKEAIREMAGRLAVTRGSTRDDAIRNVARAMADAKTVHGRLESVSPEARSLALELAWRPGSIAPPRRQWVDRYSRGLCPDRLPAEELYDVGLLLTSSEHSPAVLPREAALVLRGPTAGPELSGSPVVDPIPVDTSGVGSVVTATVQDMHRMLDRVTGEPITMLRSGGLGQREIQRVSRACGLPVARTRFLLELAVWAGLLGPDGDNQYRTTSTCRWWRRLEPGDQWTSLVTGWWRSAEPRADASADPMWERLAVPALTSLAAPESGRVRHALVEVLACLPSGYAPGDSLAPALAWRLPGVEDVTGRAESALTETEALGVTCVGALTPVGRALVERRGNLREAVGSAADALLPAVTSLVALQSDLTAVASGPVNAATGAVLDAAADREGVGVWRFSRASVRRALDTGQTGEDLAAALSRISTAPVPQVLVQLVDDVSRVHGSLRITGCLCAVVAADEALLSEVLSEHLGLWQVAPTVAVGTGSAEDLVHELRRRGFAPVMDPASGATRVTRGRTRRQARTRRADTEPGSKPDLVTMVDDTRAMGMALVDVLGPDVDPPDPRAAAHQVQREPGDVEDRIAQGIELLSGATLGRGLAPLPPEQLRMLARAQEEGGAVMIEYRRGLTTTTTSLYLLDEVDLEPGTVRAWDPEWESSARFRAYDIRSVEQA